MPKLASISRAARTARSGLSGCSRGTPKPSIRQSPAMWNTVPSWRKVISVSSEKNSLSSGTTQCGSSCSEMLVKPRRSANSTTAWARTSAVDSSVSRSCSSSRILSATRGET